MCNKCQVNGYPTGRIVVQRESGKPGWILEKCECAKDYKK